jgi:hypothetical protein
MRWGFKGILLVFTMLTVFTSACAKRVPVTGRLIEQRWLPFIQDGETTKEDVLLSLGIPTAHFEGERILVYLLLVEEGKSLNVVSLYIENFSISTERLSAGSAWWCSPKTRLPRWNVSMYHLVLVFDENGVLTKHSLLPKL